MIPSLGEHNHSAIKMLPVDFTPGIEHVVISKGKKYCKHSGNLNLRNIVQSKLSLYVNANSKASKSAIITSVMKHIGASGGFVKVDKDSGLWVEASEHLAREKTSQAFRDALRSYYKSSRENKRKNATLDTEPLWSMTIESQRQHKRRRTEMTSSKTTSSLEFPTLAPLIQSSSSCIGTPAVSVEEKDTNDSLYSRIFSLISDDMAANTATNPFEPTPFDEEPIMGLEPISLGVSKPCDFHPIMDTSCASTDFPLLFEESTCFSSSPLIRVVSQ